MLSLFRLDERRKCLMPMTSESEESTLRSSASSIALGRVVGLPLRKIIGTGPLFGQFPRRLGAMLRPGWRSRNITQRQIDEGYERGQRTGSWSHGTYQSIMGKRASISCPTPAAADLYNKLLDLQEQLTQARQDIQSFRQLARPNDNQPPASIPAALANNSNTFMPDDTAEQDEQELEEVSLEEDDDVPIPPGEFEVVRLWVSIL